MIRTWWYVPLVWLAAAVGALLFGAPTSLAGPERAQAGMPSLEQVRTRDAAALTQQLRSVAVWGPSAGSIDGSAAQAVPLSRPDWRIIAVVDAPDPFAVVQVGEAPPVELRPGQNLPDGSTIRRIRGSDLYLVVRGNQRILRADIE